MARGAATWVADHEWWLILLAAPPLLLSEFAAPLIPLATAVLVATVLARLVLRRRLRFGGVLDLAILMLVVMMPVSLWVSSDPARSYPKFYATVAGLFLFWSLATGVRREKDLRGAAVLLALSGIGLAILGLLGTDWPSSKVLYLPDLYARLPRLMMQLPRSTRGRFDANEVAGALVMLIPVIVAMLMAVWALRRDAAAISLADLWPSRQSPVFLRRPGVLFALILLSLLAAGFVFILSQSRGGLVSLLIGLLILLAVHSRRAAVAVIAAVTVLALVLVLWDVRLGGGRMARAAAVASGGANVQGGTISTILDAANVLTRVGASDTATATGRVEMWGNAARAIADYPFTGAGWNTFPTVSWANYGYRLVSPTWNMTHAHNEYLQAGVDFGVAGLVAFLLMASALLGRAVRVVRRRPAPFTAWLMAGLLAGLSGHLVHGLVDVVARPLGDKPGIIFWAMAGLLLAVDEFELNRVGQQTAEATPAGFTRRGRVALALAVVAVLFLLWSVVAGPLLPAFRLNLGAVALDQARLTANLGAAQQQKLLQRAETMLVEALPWRADTVNLRLGIIADKRGQSDRATAYWSKSPLALPFLLIQGDTARLLDEPAAVKRYYAQAVAVDPASSSAQYRAGVQALSEGRKGDALVALQRALALDNYYQANGEEEGKTHSAIAGIMEEQRRWDEAVRMYERAQAVWPGFTDQIELAWALFRRDGGTQSAEAYLRQQMSASPQLYQPWVGLTDMLHAAGRDNEAVAVGTQAVQRFPDSSAPLLSLANVYIDLGAFDKAEQMARRAVLVRPRQPEARVLLGRALLAQKKPPAAIDALKEAIRLAPNRSSYYLDLGKAYRLASDFPAAANAFRRVLELEPGNAEAQLALDGLPK